MVSRYYERRSSSLDVKISCGPSVTSALRLQKPGHRREFGKGHVAVDDIDGFWTLKVLNNDEKSGVIVVVLGRFAVMSVGYNGMVEDEALSLARKFDWRSLAATK